jgi:hypothetical protein
MASEIEQNDRDLNVQTAYFTLLAGGLIGGLMVIASLVTSFYWWGPLVDWLRDAKREHLWEPLAALAGLLVGLAIMFGAFQSARKFERVDVTLRRVLYGYISILQLVLLGLLLATVVVFVQIRYPLPFDTTEGGFFSLSEKTKQFLTALDKPVEVYMLLSPEDETAPGAYQGMKTVLSEMESLNPRFFHYEEVAIDGTNTSRIRDLAKRFSRFSPRPGLLVTYGDKPELNHSYISANELVNLDFSDNQKPQRSFNGEVRLMQELYFLAEDRHRPVVYITQGHGEPDMSDRTAEGLSELVQRLNDANYEVRPLTTTDPSPEKNSVPADADVVLVIGPKKPMNDIIPGLRRYMSPTDPAAKKGKMIAMLGATGPDRQRGNRMIETGMEGLLKDFSVEATNEQILTFIGPGGEIMSRGNQPYPEAVLVGALRTATEAQNPLAQLVKTEDLYWVDVRRLNVLPGHPGAKFAAEPILATAGYCWVESDLSKSSLETWQTLRTDKNEQKQRLKREPLSVLVAVTESTQAETPPNPEKKPSKSPRLAVFGCSTMATNQYVRKQAGGIEFDLIRGSIDWARERFSNIGVEPKSYHYFMLGKQTSYWNLFYLPLGAMGLSVFGLGMIIWNIRRR